MKRTYRFKNLNEDLIFQYESDVSNLSNLDIERVEVVLGPASSTKEWD